MTRGKGKGLHTFLVAFIDKDGKNISRHVKTKSSRRSKVKAQIEQAFNIKADECKDFKFTEVNYYVGNTNIK